MADDKVLSMSLDEIIRLKRSEQTSDNQKTNIRKQYNGPRGRGATYRVKPGKSRTPLIRAPIRKTAGILQTPYANPRGTLWRRGLHVAKTYSRRNWNLDANRQRQHNIALGKSRLQVAKRFLNQRQRGSTRGMMVSAYVTQPRKMPWQGVGQMLKRGRGAVHVSGLSPNSFRSDQLIRLSRVNSYQNKINRRLSATRHNQLPTGPSLIVSIDNERAGPSTTESLRGMRRRGARRGNGAWNRQQMASFGRVPEQVYQLPNALPYHTGALDPEIQMVIADIQGKRTPNQFGPANSNLRRGTRAIRGRGVGRLQRFGRTQLTQGHNMNYGRFNSDLSLGITVNTLNERFGGMK